MRPPSRNRQTFEIKKGYASAFITTDVPPGEWSHKFIDNAFKATGQRPVEPRGRRQVHFTPPQLMSKGVSINLVEPEPQVPTMPIQFVQVGQSTAVPPRPRRKSRPITPVIPARKPTRSGYQPLPSDPVLPFPAPSAIPTYPVVPPIEEPQCPFPCFRSRSRSRSRSRERRTIYFYDRHDVYFGFTNFSPHSIYYEGKKYPTSEHLYQSFKFVHNPELAEHVRTCSTLPRVALAEAKRLSNEVRPDWKKVQVKCMDVVLWHKFDQHSSLRHLLLSTENAVLLEDSRSDAFWGIGPDGNGKNELGKALQRLRKNLQGTYPR